MKWGVLPLTIESYQDNYVRFNFDGDPPAPGAAPPKK